MFNGVWDKNECIFFADESPRKRIGSDGDNLFIRFLLKIEWIRSYEFINCPSAILSVFAPIETRLEAKAIDMAS